MESVDSTIDEPARKRQKTDDHNFVCVKPEFLVPRSAIVPEPKPAEEKDSATNCENPSECATPGGDNGEAKPDAKQKKERKPTRRQERKQRITLKKEEAANKICPAVLRGEQCSNAKCEFTHDIEQWKSKQPPPLTTLPCPNWTSTGQCPFYIACRFHGSHTPENMPANPPAEIPQTEVNKLPADLKVRLRKREEEFHIADAVVRHMKTKSSAPDREVMPLREKRKTVDFRGKLILAPLTTIGNLPFRRICKKFGADITIGEMALASHLLQGKPSEWALVKRHECEDVFGVQIAVSHVDQAARCVELLTNYTDIDFIDLNCGCPIDLIYNQGLGSGLMNRPNRMAEVVTAMSYTSNVPITVKVRVGKDWNKPIAHSVIAPNVASWGAAALTVHGRSKEQRYTKLADWDYIDKCAKAASIPVIGNGDIYDWTEAVDHLENTSVASLMIARGAIIKPWIFQEIKERRHIDISSSERFEMLKEFVNYGLMHWGSDAQGVERTRYFLLNWQSFLCRYVPIGICERLPVKINQIPPPFVGRDDLETLMGSPKIDDWIKLSTMLLGPPPQNYSFEPKHKANSYSTSDGSVGMDNIEG